MRKLHILLYIVTLCIIILSISQTTANGQQSLTGDWEGAINVQGTQLKIITHFSNTENKFKGTIDIPQQGGQDIPLKEISLSKEDSVHFEFMAGMGMAVFRGKMKNDTTIVGTFHQNGRQFPFELLKNSSPTAKAETPSSPTYNQEEIIINSNSVTIGGTLTWPKDQQSDELVIIISGSGAQNRNGKLPITNFKPYQALANSLTLNGISTFRYDDRGVGQSSGNFAETSLSMLVSDVETIINYFRNSTSHSFSEITLLGHSLGGVVGGKLAARNESVDNLILLASPALPLSKISIQQVKTLNQQAGVADSILAKNVALQKAIFDTLRSSQDFSKLEDSLVKFNSLAQPSVKAKKVRAQINKELTSLTKPSYYSLLDYDPRNDLEKLSIPVLAILGGKDAQVDLKMNQSSLKSALQKSGTTYQVKVFPEANHLFQKANTGSVQEYASLKSEFVDGFISTLTEWIKK